MKIFRHIIFWTIVVIAPLIAPMTLGYGNDELIYLGMGISSILILMYIGYFIGKYIQKNRSYKEEIKKYIIGETQS